jgi:hypothetical protein
VRVVVVVVVGVLLCCVVLLYIAYVYLFESIRNHVIVNVRRGSRVAAVSVGVHCEERAGDQERRKEAWKELPQTMW